MIYNRSPGIESQPRTQIGADEFYRMAGIGVNFNPDANPEMAPNVGSRVSYGSSGTSRGFSIPDYTGLAPMAVNGQTFGNPVGQGVTGVPSAGLNYSDLGIQDYIQNYNRSSKEQSAMAPPGTRNPAPELIPQTNIQSFHQMGAQFDTPINPYELYQNIDKYSLDDLRQIGNYFGVVKNNFQSAAQNYSNVYQDPAYQYYGNVYGQPRAYSVPGGVSNDRNLQGGPLSSTRNNGAMGGLSHDTQANWLLAAYDRLVRRLGENFMI